MKESERKYTGPLQFFHNFEHDPEGRKHCTGPASHPYRVKHVGGKHVITHRFAKGHGKGRKPQWFKFTRKLDNGYDLTSGIKVEGPPTGFLVKPKKKKGK